MFQWIIFGYKYLDVMYFPDLYQGYHGQRKDRNFASPDYLFVRMRLMSEHIQVESIVSSFFSMMLITDN